MLPYQLDHPPYLLSTDVEARQFFHKVTVTYHQWLLDEYEYCQNRYNALKLLLWIFEGRKRKRKGKY